MSSAINKQCVNNFAFPSIVRLRTSVPLRVFHMNSKCCVQLLGFISVPWPLGIVKNMISNVLKKLRRRDNDLSPVPSALTLLIWTWIAVNWPWIHTRIIFFNLRIISETCFSLMNTSFNWQCVKNLSSLMSSAINKQCANNSRSNKNVPWPVSSNTFNMNVNCR